jgi:outer membrane biosynthesis protein TonB
MRDSRGIIYSTVMHGVMLFLLLVGLPDFFHRETEIEPEAFTVDILPIAPITNVKPQEQPEPDDKRPVADKNVTRKATSETKQDEKAEEKPELIPDKKAKPQKKKEEKKKEKKKTDDPLKAILNDVREHSKSEEGKTPTQIKADKNAKPAKSTHYDPGAPLSMNERDAIRNQIQNCWSPPIGAKDAQNIKVVLNVRYERDGSLISVEMALGQDSRYSSDSFFRATADAALRAVKRCSPLKNMSPEKYNVKDGWSEIEMYFDMQGAL